MQYTGLTYYGPKNLRFDTMELPDEPGDNDIIVKNVLASICGSDVDVWLNGGEMHYFPPTTEFGHEVLSRVVKVGKNVQGLKPGDRIAPFPQKATPNSRKAGYYGAFSQYNYITNAVEDVNLWKLDDSISDVEAAIIEPLSVGIHCADIARNLRPEATYLVLGAGIIGFATAARLVDRGVDPSKITFVDRSEYRLEIMRKQGFNGVNNNDPDWKQKVMELTGPSYTAYGPGSNADYIFDAAGSLDPYSIEPTLFDEGMQLLRYFASMVVVGVHRQRVNFNAQKMVFGMTNILCGSGQSDEDFRIAIRMLKERKLDYAAVVTHTFPYDQSVEAIKFACDPNQCLKVQIAFPE